MGEPLEPPSPYWVSDEGDVTLHLGDCLDVLRAMEADSVDAVVTDPPAGIAFMDREWDDFRRPGPTRGGHGSADVGMAEYGRDRAAWTARAWRGVPRAKPGGHAAGLVDAADVALDGVGDRGCRI